jgi:SHS2 domain-containing protein
MPLHLLALLAFLASPVHHLLGSSLIVPHSSFESPATAAPPAHEPPAPILCLRFHRPVPRRSMSGMYEYFEHTADLGLRVRAADLSSLFVEAAQALFAAVVEDLASVNQDCEVRIELPLDDVEYLLFDWLKQLLLCFDTEHLLFGRFRVTIDGGGLHGHAWGEPLDRDRHNLEHEVKAITYHGLNVEQTAEGWLAEVIVDI